MTKEYICNVHDLAHDSLQATLDMPLRDSDTVYATICEVMDMIKKAKQMGINMENGLTARKAKAEEYEATIADLEKSLELARSDLKDLKDEVEYLYNKLALCESQE